ncbi:MerR family transcriptional regulator, partial [Rhizobium sp. CRRU65]
MRPGEAAGEMTVGKAAAMLGVTVRTLHHWDAMGLVRPSERSAVGYRIYTAEDLLRLQRVLIYRELDLPLDEIGRLLEAGSEGVESSLRQQRDRIAERMERLEQMSGALEKLIAAHERGVVLTSEEQLAVFG